MIATGRAALPKIELTADRLLLVEGKDEVNLLGRLIKDCLKDDGQGIQILDVGSKDNFRPTLIGIKVAPKLDRPSVQSALYEMPMTTRRAASIASATAFAASATNHQPLTPNSQTPLRQLVCSSCPMVPNPEPSKPSVGVP